jgi:Helix-turn-helix domain
MSARRQPSKVTESTSPFRAHAALPALRFDVPEAAQILRMSRAQLYNRIGEGALHAQKDGARTYISLAELERYVTSCASPQVSGHV